MPLLTPKLDQRSAQDIVDELKRLIPRFCPEWTDHNVSDPGVTLIELFAWTAELLLFQMNRVPDLHYVKLMELMGMKLEPARAARAPITIWLSAAQPNVVPIDRGYEVASPRSESEAPIIFCTEEKLEIEPPKLQKVIRRTTTGGPLVIDQGSFAALPSAPVTSEQKHSSESIAMFSEHPRPAKGDALEFGFSSKIERHVLQFHFLLDANRGTGQLEQQPKTWPYKWQVYTADPDDPDGWRDCECEYDNTGALRFTGRVQIHLPVDAKCVLRDDLSWVRLCIVDGSGTRPFDDSPGLKAHPEVLAMGGVVWAQHVQVARDERIGVSDGTPGQRFTLAEKNLVEFQPTVLVTDRDGQETIWHEVDRFDAARENEPVFTLDRTEGELRFGAALRLPGGGLKQYGAIPPSGAEIRISEYHWGGGESGSVGAKTLDTPKVALPYVARVTNRQPALPGLDAESMEAAKLRAPTVLRCRERAVTTQDFEWLVEAESRLVTKAKCIPDKGDPTRATVYVLGRRPQLLDEWIPPSVLAVADGELARIRAVLDTKRLLATRVEVKNARLFPVAIHLILEQPGAGIRYDSGRVTKVLEEWLYRHLDPWRQVTEGWSPFGGRLSRQDVRHWLHGCPEAIWVIDIVLFAADDTSGEALEIRSGGTRPDMILVDEDTVLISGKHRVRTTAVGQV